MINSSAAVQSVPNSGIDSRKSSEMSDTVLIRSRWRFHRRQDRFLRHPRAEARRRSGWIKKSSPRERFRARESNRDGCNNRSRNWFLSVQKFTTVPRGRLSRAPATSYHRLSRCWPREILKSLFLGNFHGQWKYRVAFHPIVIIFTHFDLINFWCQSQSL